jgi:hypothetical protein
LIAQGTLRLCCVRVNCFVGGCEPPLGVVIVIVFVERRLRQSDRSAGEELARKSIIPSPIGYWNDATPFSACPAPRRERTTTSGLRANEDCPSISTFATFRAVNPSQNTTAARAIQAPRRPYAAAFW